MQCKRNAGENREEGIHNQNAGCEIEDRIGKDIYTVMDRERNER